MKKVFVSVNDCIPGMQIAENVFNEYGAIVVAENTSIDDRIIGIIKKLGLVKVKIYDINDEMIVLSGSELFRAQYNENLKSVKSILHDISSAKEIDAQRVNQATDTILSGINENRDIVSCINQMREVDEYLYTHSINVSLLAMLIGKWMKYDYYSLKSIVSAGFLHDIGKGKISSYIINKPGTLEKDEFEEMKKHPVYGFKLAEEIKNLNDDILKGILMHHEREDGSGYPFGLKSEQIHIYAKIIAVADIFDAMTSNRSYKKIVSPFEVIEYMEKDSFKTLDQRILNIFLKNIAAYYIGDYVKLNTGEIGEVVYINPFNISKPIIKSDDVYIDLSREKHVQIVELI